MGPTTPENGLEGLTYAQSQPERRRVQNRLSQRKHRSRAKAHNNRLPGQFESHSRYDNLVASPESAPSNSKVVRSHLEETIRDTTDPKCQYQLPVLNNQDDVFALPDVMDNEYQGYNEQFYPQLALHDSAINEVMGNQIFFPGEMVGLIDQNNNLKSGKEEMWASNLQQSYTNISNPQNPRVTPSSNENVSPKIWGNALSRLGNQRPQYEMTKIGNWTRDGKTFLSIAVEKGHESVVRLLLEKGSDIEVKTAEGEAPLHIAVSRQHSAIVRLLLENGADVEARNANGATAIHLAAEDGAEVILRLLLEQKRGIEATDHNGWTALHRAVDQGREKIVQLLLDHGASIS